MKKGFSLIGLRVKNSHHNCDGSALTKACFTLIELLVIASHHCCDRLQDILKNEGIESMLQGELTNQVMSHLRGFDTDVLVFEKDLDRARTILKEAFPEHL